MMDERSDMAADEVILPGFRFHPTDEELVGFYLKRKIQHKALSIELIRQLDIYKYDPWDLPKLATTGEKEWYFYCPRDRKYRNSARPNRVTGAGFWKATGTDRPIYSSEGTKCIGLKKSLVFYRGRAAKGTKTDWMMHEFRLPSLPADSTSVPKRPLDKNIPANESWAICRIFKKTNSMAQRALSQSWASPLPGTPDPDFFSVSQSMNAATFGSENISCTTTEVGPPIQFGYSSASGGLQHHSDAITYPTLDAATNSYNFRPYPTQDHAPAGFMFDSPVDMPVASSMILNMSPSASVAFAQPPPQQCNGLTVDSSNSTAAVAGNNNNIDHWGTLRSAVMSFPFNLPISDHISEEWKPNLAWDSPTCPSEMSTSSFSTNRCYTT